MGRLFLPGMVVSAENQGTFSDYHTDNGMYLTIAGCSWDYTITFCGMFTNFNTTDGRAWYSICSRLSKN